MKIIRQTVLTVYEDGSSKMTDRSISDRDEETGRFLRKKAQTRDDTPPLPGFEDIVNGEPQTRQ